VAPIDLDCPCRCPSSTSSPLPPNWTGPPPQFGLLTRASFFGIVRQATEIDPHWPPFQSPNLVTCVPNRRPWPPNVPESRGQASPGSVSTRRVQSSQMHRRRCAYPPRRCAGSCEEARQAPPRGSVPARFNAPPYKALKRIVHTTCMLRHRICRSVEKREQSCPACALAAARLTRPRISVPRPPWPEHQEFRLCVPFSMT